MSVQASSAHRSPAVAHPQARASSAEMERPSDTLIQLPRASSSATVAPAALLTTGPSAPDRCQARPAALLPSVKVEQRNETSGSRTVSLWRTTNVAERPAKSDPALRVVDATQLFHPGTVFFGFGKPNVYLGRVGDQQAGKVDAKSLCRAPTQVAETRGNVQSGVFIVPRNLPQAAIDAVMLAAKDAEGSRDITCVRINTHILHKAGFTLNGGSIQHTWPTDLLAALLKGRVEYKGQRVRFDIIRTTPQNLESFVRDVAWAVKTTPYRHAPAPLKTLLTPCFGAPATVVDGAPKPGTDKPLLALAAEHAAAPLEGPDHAMYFSVPSRLGGAMRRVWGPHPIVTLLHPENLQLGSYLPERLKAFDIANPSLATRVKRDVIFCPPVQRLLRHGLAKFTTETQDVREENIPGMVNLAEKYNLVVTTEGIKFMSIEGNSKVADWLLSKHVLVAGKNADVRFAGELWKAEDGSIHINRNSGTYRPSSAQLTGAIRLAQDTFPTLKFVAEDFGA